MTLTRHQEDAIAALDRAIRSKVVSSLNGDTVELRHEDACELRHLLETLLEQPASTNETSPHQS